MATWQTAVITASATIVAAIIAGSIAIWVKRRDTTAPTDDQHTTGRIQAFNNLIAAADTLQYMRAMHYLSQMLSNQYTYTDDERDRDGQVAVARFHRGSDLMDMHVVDRDAVQPVMGYFHWVFLKEDHPHERRPGPKEYERLRDLLYEGLRLTNRVSRKIEDRRKPTRDEIEQELQSRRVIAEGTEQHLYDPEQGVSMKMMSPEAMIESIERMNSEIDEYVLNVKLVRTRLEHWQEQGL